MAHQELLQLVYTSTAHGRMKSDAVRAIVETARRTNPSLDITGLLLFDGLHFFQVLEGPAEKVESLYEHIAKDPRHTRVVRILSHKVKERNFGDWSMAYSEARPEDLAQIDGLSDHFRDGGGFANLRSGQAKLLINAFLNGIWGNRAA